MHLVYTDVQTVCKSINVFNRYWEKDQQCNVKLSLSCKMSEKII